MHRDSSSRLLGTSAQPDPRAAQRRVLRPFALLGLSSPSLLACILTAMIAAGCDDSFAPIAPTDLQFSVFGYLDASADTQWIRVMPIRPLIPTSPDSFGATVTLEHLGTGRIIALRDSVFRFSHHLYPEVGSDGAYLHNFWTTERIEPGATYRFSARRNGEEPVEAVVEIPRDYESEVWLRAIPEAESDLLRFAGLKHVVFVTVTAYFRDRCGSGEKSVSYDSRFADGNVRVIPIDKVEVTPRGGECGTPEVEKRELWAVGSETEWPSGQVYSPSGLAVPEGASNISNSLGFLGGVLTKLIPYEDCAFQGGGPVPSHCPLRYDGASATMNGTVRETYCGDGAMDSATVQLREIDREPPAVRKVRTTLSNASGMFEIAALEPGIRYALRVRAKPLPDPFWGEVDIHTVHTDTLEFTPAMQAKYDVALERFTACWLTP